MNNHQIKKVTDRYYENLEVILKNIVPGFDLDTIQNFRHAYRDQRAFLAMLSEQNAVRFRKKLSGRLHRTYRLMGEIRNLALQHTKVTSLQNASQSPTEDYLKVLRESTEKKKQKLQSALLNSPVASCRKETDAFVPSEFPVADFQIYCQLKISKIISIISKVRLSDKNLNSIRKKLDDLYDNTQNFALDKHHGVISPIFRGKDNCFSENILRKLNDYTDLCMMIKMIRKSHLKELNRANREALAEIRNGWLIEKIAMRKSLIGTLKTEVISMETYELKTAGSSIYA